MSNSTNFASAVTGSIGAPTYLDRTYGQPLFHTESDVLAMRFSEDGLIWTIEECGLLRQWSLDGRQISRVFLNDLENVWQFSPTGKFVASGSQELCLWYVNSGQEAFRVDTECWITALAFSADGKLLASGHDDGSVRIWDTKGLKLLQKVDLHTVAISALAFRPNGTELASAAEDRKIRILNLESYQVTTTLLGHPDRIPALVWSVNSDLLLSAGWDTSVRIWQPPQVEPKMLLNTHSEQVTSLAISRDGHFLACADSDFEIHIWDNLEAKKPSYSFRGPTEEIKVMAFSPDGVHFASAGADHTICVWNIKSGEMKGGPTAAVRHQIAVLPQNKKELLLSSVGASLQSWETESAHLTLLPTKETIRSVAASADGRWIATSNETPQVEIWDAAKQTLVRTLNHTFGPISCLNFAPDSKTLATASLSDGLAWIWDLNEKEAILVIPEAAESCSIETLAFHPKGNLLAVGGVDFLATSGSDGAVCLWNLDEKEKLTTFDHGVTALCFDPQGRYLAGGSLKNSLVVWDLKDDREIFDLPGHTNRIGALAFSPDGSWLVSASDDCTLRVWNVLNGRLVIARTFDTEIHSLAFGENGRYLYTGNADSTCYRLLMSQLLED
ncbi:WD40 repeat domain-containing protein [Telmatocola sphagniphila]|uniref:WD40 repeat domain-containing protein n=1 Tax=Telmatocola sphagniphila TaxID=1123043 RepID=A0A8E6EWT9_9BACT|nr:WD40 repeat domain-containing protein [Telmatocola sphagniphila]QVL34315.1 WD40 repeat domain-containing protein [Telmatocola sphagniphila]